MIGKKIVKILVKKIIQTTEKKLMMSSGAFKIMKFFCVGLVLSLFGVTTNSSANEIKRLEKCYALFVKERILKTNPLWIQVAAGTLTGTDACMRIFDKGTLDSTGKISQSAGVYDPIGTKVLSSFLEFHRSQFEVKEYFSKFPSNDLAVADVIDANEPAYHFLYSLFKPNEPFSNTLTRSFGLKSVRFSSFANRTFSVTGINKTLNVVFQGNQTTDDSGAVTVAALPWSITYVPTGNFIGIAPESRLNIVTHPPTQDSFSLNRNVNEHFGSGVIGTQAYLIGNNNKPGPVTGGVTSYRAWSKNLMSDLLCRSLPSLRSSDVLTYVKIDSTLSYRKGISCMQCHASLDYMAGTIRDVRNASVFRNNNDPADVQFYTKVAGSGTFPSTPYPEMEEDADFSKRPAEGSLHYRSYDGTLVNESVSSLADLGQKIILSNDFYACTAKRYYRFLTGIDADLSDLEDPFNAPVLSIGKMNARNQVINLGQQLKQQQSLRLLIKSIISSETFIHPDAGI